MIRLASSFTHSGVRSEFKVVFVMVTPSCAAVKTRSLVAGSCPLSPKASLVVALERSLLIYY